MLKCKLSGKYEVEIPDGFRPFSMKDAKNGAEVYTNLKRKVRIVCYDRQYPSDYESFNRLNGFNNPLRFPIIALNKHQNGGEGMDFYTEDGVGYQYTLGNGFFLMIPDPEFSTEASGGFWPDMTDYATTPLVKDTESPTISTYVRLKSL